MNPNGGKTTSTLDSVHKKQQQHQRVGNQNIYKEKLKTFKYGICAISQRKSYITRQREKTSKTRNSREIFPENKKLIKIYFESYIQLIKTTKRT